MANKGTPEDRTIKILEQKLQEYELNLKEIYAQIAATILPTPEQIENWDHLKEINRIHIEQTRQQIKELNKHEAGSRLGFRKKLCAQDPWRQRQPSDCRCG
jgi:hypothetical protein